MISVRGLAHRSCRTTSIAPHLKSNTRSISTAFASSKPIHQLPFPNRRQPSPSYFLRSKNQQSRSLHLTSPLFSQSTLDSLPKTSYAISASFTAKDVRYNSIKHLYQFDPAAPILPLRTDKRTRPASGQDSFFVAQINDSSDIALGVADGVGGWVESGVDPADFSHGFCDYMAEAAHTYSPETWSRGHGRIRKAAGQSEGTITAMSLMQRGYEAICRDPSVPAGGSTACVALLSSTGKLEVANLGDSGYIQLRSNAIHAYSEPQTHAFNTPYQLSVVPEKTLRRTAMFGGQNLCDMPSDANVTTHSLRHGDVLVFASDGVWDNLSRQEILKIVSRIMLGTKAWEHTDTGVTVGSDLAGLTSTVPDAPPAAVIAHGIDGQIKQQVSLQSCLAVGITKEAKAASVNTKRNGPFSREVQKYYPGEVFNGGKVDDICVVVAIVCEDGK